MKDAARMGFEAFMAKRRPGDGRTDPWLCFQAGYLFAQVEEHRGTVHALAAIKGDRPAGVGVAAGTDPNRVPRSRSWEARGCTPGMPQASETSLATSTPPARTWESDLAEDRVS